MDHLYFSIWLRLNDTEPVKQLALWEPRHGTANRGARKLSYKDQIAKLLTSQPDMLTASAIGRDAESENAGQTAVKK